MMQQCSVTHSHQDMSTVPVLPDHCSQPYGSGSGGIYGTGCYFEEGGVWVSLGKITKIRAFPHPVQYKPPDLILGSEVNVTGEPERADYHLLQRQ